MIIWINGTYGVGKTTVANEIAKIYTGRSKVLDPDNLWLSSLKKDPMIAFGDGTYPQSNKNFITILSDKIHTITSNYDGLIIIPMAITEKTSYDTFINTNQADIKHFILEANTDILNKRICNNIGRDINLATSSMEKNIAFLNSITNAIHIETSNLLPDEVANYIIGIISK